MGDLGEPQKYAAAALFTLALHQTQEETGVARRTAYEDTLQPWGAPPATAGQRFSAGPPAGEDDATAAAWDAFWGWDCCGPDGLCERVYGGLRVPRASWAGLKMLPAARAPLHGEQSRRVKQYRDALDSSLAHHPVPAQQQPPSLPAQQHAEAPTQPHPHHGVSEASAGDADADEDLAADMRRVRLGGLSAAPAMQQATSINPGHPQSRAAPGSSLAASSADGHTDEGSFGPALQRPEGQETEPPSRGDATDDTRPASELAAQGGQPAEHAPSGEALSALTLLLEACLSTHHMPTLEDMAKELQQEGKAGAPGGGKGQANEEAQEGVQQPVVQWYDARARVALRWVALWLRVPAAKLAVFEAMLAQTAQAPEGQAEVQKESPWRARMRYAKIGAAAVGGGALLAVTGGLAAPVLAGAMAAVGSPFAGFGAAAMVGAFGAGGAHAAGTRMARRLGDVKEFGFRGVPSGPVPPEAELPPLQPVPVLAPGMVADPRLALTIGVSGSIANAQDFQRVWQALGARDAERLTLVWETQELLALNFSIVTFLKDQAAQAAGKWFLNMVAHSIVAAVSLPLTALSATSLIDMQWNVVSNRAVLAGELLAHVLMSGAHGGRPVTLIGYSMGGRLVFHCLLELARCRAKGIVEHAACLGAPIGVTPERWALARSVVAGRLVNGYSSQDWVLGLNFRAKSMSIAAAGLTPVHVPGVENANLDTVVRAHTDYAHHMPAILDMLGFNSGA